METTTSRHVAHPIIPVPLQQPPYADVLLDVGAVLDDVYLRGQFARRLDYLQPPPPPALARADLAWVQERVRVWREAHTP